jgi:hypothetical protein
LRLAGTPPRDLAAVSLDRRAAAAPPPAVAQEPAQPPAMPASWGDRIPSTREEALQILGLGVTPDANLAAVRKIVDGLRASWHPDHGSGGAEDRQMRELRLKQINAAWEIIVGKRTAA